MYSLTVPRSVVLLFWVAASHAAGQHEKPIHHWKLGESHWQDRTVTDSASSLEGKALRAPEFADGAMVFGGGNLIRVEEMTGDKLPSNEITADAWVMIEKGQAWGNILGFMQDNGSYERGWSLGYNEKTFVFWLSNGDRMKQVVSKTTFEAYQWYHVAATYDGKRLRLFVNGRLEAESDAASGPIAYPESAFYTIGAYQDDDEFFPMTGRIREARLYDRGLGSAQIDKLYAEGRRNVPSAIEFAVKPALTFATPTSARIDWEATLAGSGAVAFGKTRKLGSVAKSGSKGKLHEVTLTGLEHGTVYFYKIGLVDSASGKRHLSRTYEFNTALNFTVPAILAESDPLPLAREVLETSGVSKGYCLAIGLADVALLKALAQPSDLIIVAAESDPGVVASLRKSLHASKLHGSRISVLEVPSLNNIPLTPHFANLLLVDEGRAVPEKLLVPGSGVACLLSKDGKVARTVRRARLEGIGEWTHQYGDAANTAGSAETLGGATSTDELAVQWIGRPGADFGLDRNPRMPAPLYANGKLFHQGMDRLVALDAYNGAVLWSKEIPDLRRVNIPRDCGNWCADNEHLYVAIKDRAWVFDALSGTRKATFAAIPDDHPDHEHAWGYIARTEDLLVGSRGRANASFTRYWTKNAWFDAKKGEATGKVCSENLFAYSLETGKPAWTYASGIILNASIAIGNGRIYFVESRNTEVHAEPSRQITSEKLWLEQFLVALDARTGDRLFEKPIDTEDGTIAFYLQYSAKGILVTASNTQYHLYSFHPETGELQWQRSNPWPDDHHSGHMQHPVIVGDTIYLQPNGYSLETGEITTTKVGAREGCHTYVGTRDSLVYRGRHRQLAMWDRETESVSTWDRLRPSCWLSVIPAGGMLLVPEGGGGCSCGGWMETSLVFGPKLP